MQKQSKNLNRFKKNVSKKWIDDNFVAGAVTWEYQGSSAIKITDKTVDRRGELSKHE